MNTFTKTKYDNLNIINALWAFVDQRPGLNLADYSGEVRYYNQNRRALTKSLHDFRALLDVARLYDLPAETLRQVMDGSRLEMDSDYNIDYCAGQNWTTEYRDAACRVLATALWFHWRTEFNCDNADQIRTIAKKYFNRGVISRWFK